MEKIYLKHMYKLSHSMAERLRIIDYNFYEFIAIFYVIHSLVTIDEMVFTKF